MVERGLAEAPAGTRTPDGRSLSRLPADEAASRLGATTVGIHRARLLQILLDALPPDVLRSGTEVVGVDAGPPPTVGVVHGGVESTVQADVVVVVDGIDSRLRAALLPGSGGTRDSGATAWRAVTARIRGGAGAGPGGRGAGAGFTRGYWVVVAVEVVALFGGLNLINGVFGQGGYGVAWVAFVVGVHFVGLGAVWHAPPSHVLGAVLTGLGILGAVLGLVTGSDAWIAGVAGVGSGAALLLGTAVALWTWRDVSTA
ncbi:monooxygenase [Pseudonocardia sp. N23]|nr:monooxygenase [Pseudonocardia sp. N23]